MAGQLVCHDAGLALPFAAAFFPLAALDLDFVAAFLEVALVTFEVDFVARLDAAFFITEPRERLDKRNR